MKKILFIATGGTIASKKTERGLAPAISAEDLLQFVPELKDLCNIDTIQLFDLDSTNITPAHWLLMKDTIRNNYDRYDGFVISHGTDTMAYSAAALSYLIQHSPKPIVLTGSQQSIYNRDTDARQNLYHAFQYAVSEGAYGVHIIFNNLVILGTRARKVRSKSFNAFSSIDYPETAVFKDERLIRYQNYKEQGPVHFYDNLDPHVFVLRLVPGMNAEVLKALRHQFHALVIEGFGVGGLPGGEDGELLKEVMAWLEHGRLVVFSTQVQHEGSDLSVYEVGRIAKELPGVLEAGDMTPEAVVAKLMWVMGETSNSNEACDLFRTPIMHDILG